MIYHSLLKKEAILIMLTDFGLPVDANTESKTEPQTAVIPDANIKNLKNPFLSPDPR